MSKAKAAGGTASGMKPGGSVAHANEDHEKNLDALSPATKPEASGALQEPEIADRIDLTHPAVDANPRQGTSPDSNRIDFNDPTISSHEAVRRNLEEQGMTVNDPPAESRKKG